MLPKHIESLLLQHWEDQNMTRTPKGQANVLTAEQFKRLLRYVSTNTYAKRDTLLVYFSFGLGLRAIEMAAIKLRDVIDEQGDVVETVNLPRTKGDKPRNVFLTDQRIVKALLEYIEERKSVATSKRNLFSLNHPLFLSQKGSHFTNKTLEKLFRTIYQNAGIDASSHSGRRTFATNLIEQGMDIRAVQVLMGHSNINETAKYVQSNPERLKRITAKAMF